MKELTLLISSGTLGVRVRVTGRVRVTATDRVRVTVTVMVSLRVRLS